MAATSSFRGVIHSEFAELMRGFDIWNTIISTKPLPLTLKSIFLEDKKTLSIEFSGNGQNFQTARAGRVIKKLLPTASDNEIRTFVERMTSRLLGLQVQTFDGSAIYDWYMKDPITECVSSRVFINSCYQGKCRREFFSLMENNPDRFGILILEDDKKLAARCVFVKGHDDDGEITFFEQVHAANGAFAAHVTKYIDTLPGPKAYYDYSNFVVRGKKVFRYDYKFTASGLNNGCGLHHWDMLCQKDETTLVTGLPNQYGFMNGRDKYQL